MRKQVRTLEKNHGETSGLLQGVGLRPGSPEWTSGYTKWDSGKAFKAALLLF